VEDPSAQEDEAYDGGEQVEAEQGGHLGEARGAGGHPVDDGKARAADGEADEEGDPASNWCRTALREPRTPKVNRRFAAMLPMAARK
jgi:hypothetical protein